MVLKLAPLALSCLLTLCCAEPRVARAPDATLMGTDRVEHALRPMGDDRFVVLTFFSASCPCQKSHDARLRELFARYRPRAVAFYAIDSEVHADRERDALQASARGYPFPILIDQGASVAHALGAEYATFTVVLDRQGSVVYRGGIDSDKNETHDDATPYLADALDDVLAGRAPRRAEGKVLGCALRTW